MPLQHALQAIARLDALLHQSFAVGDQDSSFTNRQRRNPHCWDEVGSQQTGELDGIPRVGFDPCRADQLHGQGMSHGDLAHERLQ